MSQKTTRKTRQKTSQEEIPKETLLARNMAWLAESHPPLFRRLDETSTGRFDKPLFERGRIVNLEIGGTRLYEPNARAQTKQEVERYFAEKRFFAAHSNRRDVQSSSRKARAREDWRLERDVKSVFLKDARRHRGKHDGAARQERSLLVVFGLGLGYHIAPLLRRLKPCNVCILETRKENMFFAARSQDFTLWSRLCAERQGRVFFVVEEEVEELEKVLTHVLLDELHFFADDFFFYRHTTMGAGLRRLEPRMADILQSALRNKGFFEDQLRMLENSVSNLSLSASHTFLKEGLRVRQKEEALILANGPSLDDALGYLKSLCRGRVVFSCGSTLYTLLKNGIVPHYHCEIENVFPPAHHLEKIREAGYALDGITLLAAITVQSDVVANFSERVFFSRPLVPFSCASDIEPLSDVAPTVANTAFSCAQAMGFSTFIMLGVDCGYKQGRLHHAKDAVHFLDETFKKHEDERQRRSHLVFRGNFGGYVRSQEVFLATKQMLESRARVRPMNRYYNCSDGAFIRGFVPMLPSLIEHIVEPIVEPLVEPLVKPLRHDRWRDLCPRVSLAETNLRVCMEQAQGQIAPCAQHLEGLFATLQEVSSITDLQRIHSELKTFFAPNRVASISFVRIFYTGSVFIFFSEIYQCFLATSPRRWRRLRVELSLRVRCRLRSMQPCLERSISDALERVRQE